MFVGLHMLRSFGPSCLNRDDHGNSKACYHGDVLRDYVSSQCWKRAWQTSFDKQCELEGIVELTYRTRYLVQKVAEVLVKDFTRNDKETSRNVKKLLAGVGLKTKSGDCLEALGFFSQAEVNTIAKLCNESWDVLSGIKDVSDDEPDGAEDESNNGSKDSTDVVAPVKKVSKKSSKDKKKEAKEELPNDLKKKIQDILENCKYRSIRQAISGRMLADFPSGSIEGAQQVAFATSVNASTRRSDWYCAMDDLQETFAPGTTGATMIGDASIASPCLYQYINMNLDQVKANLNGNCPDMKKIVRAWLNAWFNAMPSGKENALASGVRPSFVMVIVKDQVDSSGSFSGAFSRPVTVRRSGAFSLEAEAINRICGYWEGSQVPWGVSKHIIIKVARTFLEKSDSNGKPDVSCLNDGQMPSDIDDLVKRVIDVIPSVI